MGDEHVGEALLLLLELLKQVDDLGLDGDVEGGDGLVADDQGGLSRQGAGDGDALPLSAAELMGEAVRHAGVEPRHEEELLDLLLVLLVALHQMVHPEGLADDAPALIRGLSEP